jgi:putative ABC transport system permease protein
LLIKSGDILIQPGSTAETLKFLEQQWEKTFSGMPLNYDFLDDIFGRQFRQIERSRKLYSYFTFLAIFVACLGLYGMASFSAVQRTKEIGVRKVLGSTNGGIIKLLGKELAILILMGNVVAWPFSYVIMKQWIQNFP